MSYYVVAHYADSDAYGGPEEGGWWYRTSDLIDVVQGSRFEDLMNDYCYAMNTSEHRSTREHYEVVELGRLELREELRAQSCHNYDFEPEGEDFVERWDVPRWLPEGRPHYC